MKPTDEEIARASESMDWQQVVQNGGPPCFFLQNDGRFCGRAKQWEGHNDWHEFVSFKQLILAAIKKAKE